MRKLALSAAQLNFLVTVLDPEWFAVDWTSFSKSANANRDRILRKAKKARKS